MTSDMWRDVERLYHDALERTPDERAGFLAATCGDDGELRAEVESLLEYQSHAHAFIETSAGDALAGNILRSRLAASLTGGRATPPPGRFAGTTIGAYAIESLIAAGGMGEVYRARDTRLDRAVAIKMLHEHIADDHDRRDRFQREARLISSLNHPHICALYDVGVHDGAQFLIMEYVEGETLHDRIARGAVPAGEALEALTQIVDALDRAHRHGIVHRDLKPSNIMWTASGVKLLDFGLAVRRPRGDSENSASAAHAQALTVEGTIMGTVQYMAPEQLEGLAADERTDIFAFGAVAYEMLTATRAFNGNTRAAVIGAVLRDEPRPIADVSPGVPAPLGRTISRCLAKKPEARWQTAADLLFQMRCLAASSDSGTAAAPSPRRSRWLNYKPWMGVAGVAVVAGALWLLRGQPQRVEDTTPLPPLVFSVSPARGTSLSGFSTPFAVSPDGRHLAYVAAGDDGVKHLWIRALDAERDRQLPGTEGADTPFWSPDSQWAGFFSGRSLKKARVSTGIVQTIASDVATSGGATWGIHDDIVFPGSLRGLTRVSASGGPVSLLDVEPGNQFSPQFLGDGRRFIYAATGRSALAVADLDGGAPRTVMTLKIGTTAVGYGRGYIFFVQDGVLFARAFDERRLEFTGEARQLAAEIPAGIPSRSPFSVSASGVLAYWTSPLGAPAVLTWRDREGRSSTAVATPARYRGFSLAPDGERLVFARIAATGGVDLWLRNLRNDTETRITFDGAAFIPLWSPDGTQIAFSGFAVQPPPMVYVKPMQNERTASLVGDVPFPTFVMSWTPDSRALVVGRAENLPSHNDLWTRPVARGPSTRLWFSAPANEMQGKISPDGQWIAYVTDESGRSEVWVASYPSGEAKYQVSRTGGDFPIWGTGELFFLSPDGRLMATPVTADGAARLRVDTPRPLFSTQNLADVDPSIAAATSPFVATPDGRRFLVAERAHDPATAPITVVVNWPALMTP